MVALIPQSEDVNVICNGEPMNWIGKSLACYLSGALSLSGYAIYNSIDVGAANPDYVMMVLISPIQAIFTAYDVLVLGQMKLFWELFFFCLGSVLAVLFFYLFAKKRKAGH